jgi:hypothetical protein
MLIGQGSVTFSLLARNVSLCSCSSAFSHDCLFPTSEAGILTFSYDDPLKGLALDFGFVYDVPDQMGRQTPYDRRLDGLTYPHLDTA